MVCAWKTDLIFLHRANICLLFSASKHNKLPAINWNARQSSIVPISSWDPLRSRHLGRLTECHARRPPARVSPGEWRLLHPPRAAVRGSRGAQSARSNIAERFFNHHSSATPREIAPSWKIYGSSQRRPWAAFFTPSTRITDRITLVYGCRRHWEGTKMLPQNLMLLRTYKITMLPLRRRMP